MNLLHLFSRCMQTAACVAVLSTGASAAQLLYEGFNYPTGTTNIAGQNGGTGWNGGWQAITGGADVAAGSLVAGASAPAGYDSISLGNRCFLPNARRVGRNLNTAAGGPFATAGYVDGSGRVGATGKILYISFMQQANAATSFYEFEFHRGDLGDPGRIGGVGNDLGGSTVNLRTAGVQTAFGTANTNVNFYVVRIDFQAVNDDVRVYMNPTSATEPATPTLTKLAASDMSFTGISFGAFLSNRTVAHDEIRMGETWADVTSPPPPPPVAPQITSNPIPKNAYVGANVTLAAAATGTPQPTFQWYKGVDALGGKTSASLTLTNVQPTDEGDYSVVATNSQGSAPSASAHVTVLPVPAGLLAYEGFNYPAGSANLPGNAEGIGWGGAWTAVTGGGENVAGSSLTAAGSAPPAYDTHSIGGSIDLPNSQRDGRFLDTSLTGIFATHGYRNATGNIGADGKTLYISFTQQPNGVTNFYEFEFHRSDLGDPGRIGGVGNDLGAPASTVNLRTAALQTPFGQGNTNVNFYVVRIDYKAGNDDVRVYMNPTSLTEPPAPTLTMTAVSDMSFNGISFGAFVNGRTVKHDEVRLGETWESVAPSVPPTYPLVSNSPATSVTSSSAVLNGSITRVGSDVPSVTVYYGTTDGGTTAANWQNSVSVGAQSGPFSTPAAGLQPFTRYYFTTFAQNSSGGSWASAALDFATPPAAPVMANIAASELSIVSARVGATVVNTGGRAPAVTLYYGPTDGGTNAAAWLHSVSLGALTDSASTVIGGLTANTQYFFRVFGANEGGSSWAPATATFTTPVAALPSVDNLPATQINGFSATLGGHVNSSGNAPTTVAIYYGPADGGTNAASWAHSVSAGLQTGDFSKIVAGLAINTPYYFRARAQNAAGTAWAPSTATFTTTGFTPVTVYLNEFVAATDNDDPHPYRDADGSPQDWIELYNPTASAADIGGYFLTDTAAQLSKWRFPSPTIIPANGYLVVFASNKNRAVSGQELHTNFKLADQGEYLALVQPNGTTIVKDWAPAFPTVPEYWSYGLTLPSSGGVYRPFQIPTPGAANTTTPGVPAGDVIFSIPTQTFSAASVSLTLTTASPTAQIRYTTDRSVPGAGSTLYSGPIVISTTTMIRARAFESGAEFAPGLVHSKTYVKLGTAAATFTSNLPVVILNNFNGGRPDADKEMSWTMFTPDAATNNRTALTNLPVLATRGRMVVRGSSSAGWPKYSMNIEAWDEFNEDVDVSPLGMKPEADWILGANYGSDRAMIRNPFMYEMSNRIGRWAAHCKFVEVFANTDNGTVDYPGDYMGVYVFMEKPERGVDRIPVERLNPDDLSGPKLTGGYIIRVDRTEPNTSGWVTSRNFPLSEPYGSICRLVYDYPSEQPAPLPSIPAAQSAYIRNYVQEFEDAIVQPNRTNPTTGLHYTQYIDRNSWVDHALLNILSQNMDGFRLSTFMFKPRGDKLFAGPIWDFDLAMNSTDGRSANPIGWNASGEATDFFTWGWWKYLWPDPDFWQRFVDRWSELREGPLTDASIAALIADYYSQLSEGGVRNYAKWTAVPPRDGPDADAVGTYLDEMDILRTWLQQRTAWIDSQLVAKPVRNPVGGLAGSVTLTAAQGVIYYTLDGTDPRLPGGSVNPVALTLASGGSVTISNGVQLIARTKLNSLWSAPSSSYYFTTPPAAAGSIVVSELNYHPADPTAAEQAAGFNDSDLFEFIELMNISGNSVDLGGSRFTAGVDFTFAPNTILAAGQRLLVVSNRAAFAARYPSVPSASIAGEYLNDQFNNAGEFVRLESAAGVEIFSFTYGTSGLWPVEADGGGRSLVLNLPISAPDANSPLNWHASATSGGSPLTTDAVGYEEWKTAHGIATDSEDGDHDGLVALIEYATGGDPTRSDALGIPAVQKNGAGEVRVTLTHALSAEDVDFALQLATPDPRNFDDTPFVIESRSVSGASEVIVCKLTSPPAGARASFRVRWFTRTSQGS